MPQTTPANRTPATEVVIKVENSLLNHGRTLLTDNHYRSSSRSHVLIQKTESIGTLNGNRKLNPITEIDHMFRSFEKLLTKWRGCLKYHCL